MMAPHNDGGALMRLWRLILGLFRFRRPDPPTPERRRQLDGIARDAARGSPPSAGYP